MLNFPAAEGDRHTHQPTPQETALIAVHVTRAAELRQQMDLLLLRSMTRETEEQQA